MSVVADIIKDVQTADALVRTVAFAGVDLARSDALSIVRHYRATSIGALYELQGQVGTLRR